ncbi:MAG: DNA-binding response regulator [Firmicutes bacterium HGW-Firmicutes-7]|nr:MAG: DNA-binding response regulator [Firmicutes bacterium HGW-Firmicutes-7]
MIRLMIVDDQDLIVQGLSMILSQEVDFQVVCVAANGVEAVRWCDKEALDIILMDIRMPKMDGVEATLKIKEQYDNIKIIMLTTFNDDAYIFGSLKNGASGYLLKDATPDEIVNAIRKVYSGGTLINADVATRVVERLTSSSYEELVFDERVEFLTGREKDICHLLGEGKNNKEISDELYISEGTVKNNITRVLDKLAFRDRTQLALFAVKNKL